MAHRVEHGVRLRSAVCSRCTRLAICFVLAVFPGCKPEGSPKLSAGERPNVLLIITDTTRADELGCYGGQADVTPKLDALALSGARFASARAHAPWTLPSIASLLTSRHPAAHGAGGHLGDFTALPADIEFLPELLRQAGYATGAVLNVLFLSERFGMTRGFEHVDYYESASNTDMRRAEQTTDAALAWIESVRSDAFFALVHYFDPHLVYDPPEPFRGRFADQQDIEKPDMPFGTIEDMKLLRAGAMRLTRQRVERMHLLYRGEVAYMDEQIGRLLDGLRRLGLFENTLVIVVGDHGEEFFDHHGFEHGHSLHEEIVRVPLIFAGYEIPDGMVVDAPVGLIDVAPTICELADVPVPAGFAGRSLLPAFEGLTMPPHPILSQGNMWGPALDSLVSDGYKLIRTPRGRMLFNLATDPREHREIALLEPERAQQMDDDLKLLLESVSRSRTAPVVALSEEDRQRLCSLGYISCGE